MFNIAKATTTKDENLIAKIIKIDSFKYDKENENSKKVEKNVLDISLNGNLDDVNYSLNFIINKPIEDLNDINLFDKINIDNKDLIESYLLVDGVYYDVKLDIIFMRFSDKYTLEVSFNDYDNVYYGNAIFDINIE